MKNKNNMVVVAQESEHLDEDKKRKGVHSKRFFSWFQWHLVPEVDVHIESVLEIACFLCILLLCLYYYYKFNCISFFSEEIQIECLRNPNEYYKGSKATILYCYPYSREKQIIDLNKNDNSVISKNHLGNMFSLGEESSESNVIIKVSIGSNIRTTPPYRAFLEKDSLVECFDSIAKRYEKKWSKRPVFYAKREIPSKRVIPRSSNGIWEPSNNRDTLGFVRISETTNTAVLEWFLPHFLGVTSAQMKDLHNTTFQSPRKWWGAPQDLSQAYYHFSLKSSTVDSISFGIDFMGATEFYQMDPEPDIRTYSSVVYCSQEKIQKIIRDGLLMYVHFPEYANLQSARLYILGAIISALITIFVCFIVLASYKLFIRINHHYCSIDNTTNLK